MTSTKSPTQILSIALATGCLFDILFWGKLPGLSVLLFVLTLLAALVSMARLSNVSPVRRNLWLVAPLVFFAAMVAVRANGFLLFLDIFACLVLLALLAYFYAAGRVERMSMLGYWLSFFDSSINALFRAAPLIPAAMRSTASRPAATRRAHALLPLLRGLLIALPIALVFMALLASADIVFAGYVAALFTFDYLPDLQSLFWQAALAIFIAWIVAGGLALAITRRDTDDNEPWEAALSRLPNVLHIGFIEGATVLLVIDLIFLFFGWIQLSYLFGGQANITVDGFTYADYARRGFFELIAVSLLTLALILGLHWITWRETFPQAVVFRILGTVMAVLTLLLLASAFYRMWLYEDAYGYTALRLYVHVFEVWLALLFGWLMVTLWVKPRHFALGCFIAAIGFLVTLNIINPDALIAQQNLARYASTGKLDAYYLADLSEDAVPTLLQQIDMLDPLDRNILLSAFNEKLDNMNHNPSWQDLPSLNLSRLDSYNALTQRQALLSQVSSDNIAR